MDEQKRTYRKWLKRNHGGLSFTSNDNYPNWPNNDLGEHFMWWQGGRIGIEPPINRDSVATTSETKKRQKLSRTTSAVTDSKSVAKSASIELSHEIAHENRSGTSVEHIKTTTIKLNDNMEEKMVEVHTHPSHMLRITHTRVVHASRTYIEIIWISGSSREQKGDFQAKSESDPNKTWIWKNRKNRDHMVL